VLVVVSAAAAALPMQATPPQQGRVMATGTCFVVVVTVEIVREGASFCTPPVPPLPPDVSGSRPSAD